MISVVGKSNSVEIVSPAGNFEKLKFAVKYGADAVYFSGQRFNLRDKAGNLDLNEIEEGVKYCRNYDVKTIFLLNSFLHEDEIINAKSFIDSIKNFEIDAFVISDPGMIILLQDTGVKSDIHISTQMSTLNHLSVKLWNSLGIRRVILARETTLDDIKSIRENTDSEIEIFVHGALCISYSGRCLLSRYLSGRDSNEGNCSHPCRWNYALIEEKRPGYYMEIIEHAKGTEILSSKDLCLIEKLSDYYKAGVNAFKIEGRMKSIYYTANTTRIYKHAIKTFERDSEDRKFLPFWMSELDLVSHRPYTKDLFNEFDNMGFNKIPYVKKVLFIGYKLHDGRDKTEAFVKIFNPIYVNEEIEAIFPIVNSNIRDDRFYIKEIIQDNESIDMAQPGKVYLIRFDKEVDNDAIFRRRIEC